MTISRTFLLLSKHLWNFFILVHLFLHPASIRLVIGASAASLATKRWHRAWATLKSIEWEQEHEDLALMLRVQEKLSPLRRISELNKALYHISEVHSWGGWACEVQASTVPDVHVSTEGWPQEVTGKGNSHSIYAPIHKEKLIYGEYSAAIALLWYQQNHSFQGIILCLTVFAV